MATAFKVNARMKNKLILQALSLISVSLMSADLHAAEYFVAPGSSAGEGTKQSPWSVKQAGSKPKAGDVVIFQSGKYDVALDVSASGTEGEWITFRSEKKHAAVFEGFEKTGITISQQNYIRVEGFRINKAKGNGIRVLGKCDHITISDNYIYASQNSSIAAWGAPWQSDAGDYRIITNLIVEKNEIEKSHINDGYNEQITFAMGIYGFEIRDNHLFNGGGAKNGGEGIDIKEGVRNGKNYRNHIGEQFLLTMYLLT